MEIKRSGSQPSGKGPADWFTGTVRIDPLFSPPDPARVAGALVTFEPGARTAWHTHPLGQTLIVTSGCGWVQREGGPVEEIRPGDVVWFEPGEKHWHGAAPTTAMTHIAIQEKLNGIAGRLDGARQRRAVPRRLAGRVTGTGRTAMRATVMYGRATFASRTSPTPTIVEPTDAVVRVTRACICGSDLWPYNLEPADEPGSAWATRRSASSRPSAPRSAP